MSPIVQSPSPVLRQPTKPILLTGVKLEKIVTDMVQTMVNQNDPEGVGLAANQIGLPYRLFVARFATRKTDPVHIFINPEVLSHTDEFYPDSKAKQPPLEGCLSVLQYYGVVQRFKEITLRYQTPKNGDYDHLETKTETFKDFPATVIQHELDHLEGKIFIERILEQQNKLYKVTGKDKKGKDIWEEVQLF